MNSALLALLLSTTISVSSEHAQLSPLQGSDCELPSYLRGTTGHALFRYVVNKEGNVTTVETLYATTNPESVQQAFTAALSKCLMGWRYQQAKHEPAAGSVPLLIAFHYFEPLPPGTPTVQGPDGRSIPKIHLDQLRAEKIRLAHHLLGRESVEIHEDGWTLLTNVRAGKQPALLKAIARTEAQFGSVFVDALPAPPSSDLTIIVFRDDDSFNQVAAFDNLVRFSVGVAGQYSPFDRIAYASMNWLPQPIAVANVTHQVTRHLVAQRLFRDGRAVPDWVSEGIASFLELMPDEPGAEPSSVARGRQKDGGFSWNARGSVYLEATSPIGGGAGEERLVEFLSSSFSHRDDFTCGLSWLMVHFLLTGEQAKHRAAFESWLLAKADASDGSSILAAVGLSPKELRSALSKHRRHLMGAAY